MIRNIDKAAQIINLRVYKPLEYEKSIGSTTENIASWLQALGYRFNMRYYDGKKATLVIEECSPIVIKAGLKKTAACMICGRIFGFTSPNVKINLTRSDNYCTILINRKQ